MHSQAFPSGLNSAAMSTKIRPGYTINKFFS